MKDKILQYLIQNPGLSSSDLAQFFSISRIAVYKHLKNLKSENKIYRTGITKMSRYFPIIEKERLVTLNFYKEIQSEIIDAYDGFEEVDVKNLLEELLSYLKADGEWKYGIEAFQEKMYKENNLEFPEETLLKKKLLDFFYSFLEEERKRRKNGFFYGAKSLIHILKNYDMPNYIDDLIFTQIAYLSGFGRLRGANEIYWGKKDQSERLLRSGIEKGIKEIKAYVIKNKIQYCIYTPPTMKRRIQFRGVLKKCLAKRDIILHEISCEKKQMSERTLKPQKDTSRHERIINARTSMRLQNMADYLHVPEIIIFDDNFTTGATVNAIAEMMRQQKYTGKITAITLTGNFEYIPGITDEGDI